MIIIIIIKGNSQKEDIIDEAINLFRANCLFKNFEFKGNADRVLVYLIVYISECLSKINQKSPLPNKLEGYKILNSLALQNFSVPGDPNFPLNAFFEAPTDRNQNGKFHINYFIYLNKINNFVFIYTFVEIKL